MPPSQRWFTNGIPTRRACSAMASWACLFVPPYRTERDGLLDELVGAIDEIQGLLEVDDVDAVALGEDEPLHLRVPAPGLMTEMHAALEQLSHGDDRCHAGVPSSRAPRHAGMGASV